MGPMAIVATIAQNTVGVTDIYPFLPQVGVKQIETVIEDIGADTVKTGCCSTPGSSPPSLAEKAVGAWGVTVAATGEIDCVSGGGRTLIVENGHALMGRVVGLGCASTAVVGCFAAADGGSPETVAEALAYFGLSGEVAAEGTDGPGTFEPRLLDALAELAGESDRLAERIRAR